MDTIQKSSYHSPITPYPAVMHGHFEGGVSYSSVWNLLGTAALSHLILDYPCAAFPVTFANEQRDPKLASYIPLNDTDKAIYEKCALHCVCTDNR